MYKLLNKLHTLFYFLLSKNKKNLFLRIEKDRGQIAHEIGDVRAATDEVSRSKVSSYKFERHILNEQISKI